MKLSIYSFVTDNTRLTNGIAQQLRKQGHDVHQTRVGEMDAHTWAQEEFGRDGLIVIGDVTRAVRAVARPLAEGAGEPALAVVSENGQYAVSVLPGREGMPDLAILCGRLIEATPVVTAIATVRESFSLLSWAKSNHIRPNRPTDLQELDKTLRAGGTVKVSSEKPISGTVPAGIELAEAEGDIVVTTRTEGKLRLVPQIGAVGLICPKSATGEELAELYRDMMTEAGLDPRVVSTVCTLDELAQEPGVVEFAWALRAKRQEVCAFELEEHVEAGDSLCERAAVLGADGGYLIVKRMARDGIEMSVAFRSHWPSWSRR